MTAVRSPLLIRHQRVSAAKQREGVQEVQISVKGGYSPNLIRVREGVPPGSG